MPFLAEKVGGQTLVLERLRDRIARDLSTRDLGRVGLARAAVRRCDGGSPFGMFKRGKLDRESPAVQRAERESPDSVLHFAKPAVIEEKVRDDVAGAVRYRRLADVLHQEPVGRGFPDATFKLGY